jgi:hypothetical protein
MKEKRTMKKGGLKKWNKQMKLKQNMTIRQMKDMTHTNSFATK